MSAEMLRTFAVVCHLLCERRASVCVVTRAKRMQLTLMWPRCLQYDTVVGVHIRLFAFNFDVARSFWRIFQFRREFACASLMLLIGKEGRQEALASSFHLQRVQFLIASKVRFRLMQVNSRFHLHFFHLLNCKQLPSFSHPRHSLSLSLSLSPHSNQSSKCNFQLCRMNYSLVMQRKNFLPAAAVFSIWTTSPPCSACIQAFRAMHRSVRVATRKFSATLLRQ